MSGIASLPRAFAGAALAFATIGGATAVVRGVASESAFQPDPPPGAIENAPAREATDAPWVIDQRNLRAELSAIDARSSRIREELADASAIDTLPEGHWAHEWAGQYNCGGFLNRAEFLVAPGTGITYKWCGCQGCHHANQGEILGTFDIDEDGKPDGLRIEWALHPFFGFELDSDRYIFVTWPDAEGGPAQRFLVPESKMLDLVNGARSGWNSLLFAPQLSGRGKDQRPTGLSGSTRVGLPIVPEPWASALESRVDVGNVSHVAVSQHVALTDGDGSTICRITIDVGRSDGVFLGMRVRYPWFGDQASLTAIEITDHSSTFECNALDSRTQSVALPVVGQRLRILERISAPRDR